MRTLDLTRDAYPQLLFRIPEPKDYPLLWLYPSGTTILWKFSLDDDQNTAERYLQHKAKWVSLSSHLSRF